MDALDLFRLRYDAIHGGFVDDLLAGLDDGQLRARPLGMNSILWLLWHVARVEDVAINRFVADRPQTLLAGKWNRRLGIDPVDAGPGMTPEEADDLGRRIDLPALRGYWDAVAAASRGVADGLDAAALDAAVDPDHVRAVVRGEGVLRPAGGWVGGYWAGGHPRGWFLLQTALLHPYGHLFEALAVRGVLMR